MAVNKNFVVKNGLEVNTKLILADATNQKVGIGSTAPKYELEVAGGIGATTMYTTGISSFASQAVQIDPTQSVQVGTGLSVVGVTTLASAGGITTTGGRFFVGENLNVCLLYTSDAADE